MVNDSPERSGLSGSEDPDLAARGMLPKPDSEGSDTSSDSGGAGQGKQTSRSGTHAKPAGDKSSSRKHKFKSSKFELPILVAIAIAVAILLKTFVIQPFYIPSQSMERTLHGCPGCGGDRIVVFKPVYRVREPHPGDITVFKAPPDWHEGGGVVLSSNPVAHGVQWFGQLIGVVPPSEKDLVKRVIAVGGETVRCCDADGNVQISTHGVAGPWRSLNEPFIFENNAPNPWIRSGTPGSSSSVPSGRIFGPVTVPKGRLWVMGDHRSDSADSRYHCGPGGNGPNCDPVQSTVSIDDVIGKSVVIAWPPSRWRTLGTPQTFTALGLPGLGALPTEPAAAGLIGFGLFAGLRRHNRRRKQLQPRA
jgi:signal peptidase I